MRTIFILFTIVMTLNVSAQNFIGKKKDIDAIRMQADNLSSYFVKRDAEAIASIYVRNGKLFPPGKEIVKNRPNIEEHYAPKEGRGKTVYHKIISKEIVIEKKKIAYDYGYYEGKYLNAENEVVEFRGKYVVIWKKIDDEWLIYLDIWNSIRDEE